MIVHIDANKHIGLIFQPRSGSHVVREYLARTTGMHNLTELFNYNIDPPPIHIINDELYVKDEHTASGPTSKNSNDHIALSITNLDKLSQLSNSNQLCIFGVLVSSYFKIYPELSANLAARDDIQYIRLSRADVLYSLLSVISAQITNDWHIISSDKNKTLARDPKIIYPIHKLSEDLKNYVAEQDEIMKHFGNAPVIYYEEFQNKPSNLCGMFTGIPKKLVSIPFAKLGKKYKDLVENIDEVEDFYEQFVNDHKEYFPQYFNKLENIIIPANQGRQPKDLSADGRY